MSAQGKALAERPVDAGEIMESVIAKGDLGKLTPEERSRYYLEVCKSVGLNPLTQPFAYITLNGKLTLYALRGCTDQLRAIHKVSVEDLTETERGDVFIVTAKVKNGEGRTDMAKGAVTIGTLKGDALANMIMKAETKAKRRATLSICGLGVLDETEIETIPQAQPVKRTREEISADANRKRQEVRDVEKDVLQIDTLAALDRYQREVLTPQFMAGLGMKQYVVEEYVARRRQELAAAPAAPADGGPEEVDDPSPAQNVTLGECRDWLETSSDADRLKERAQHPGYLEGVKTLTVHQRNELRAFYKTKLEGFGGSVMHDVSGREMHPLEAG